MNEFTAEVHGDPYDYTVVTKALIEEVDYQWQRFNSRQSTPTTRASAIIQLSNAVSDLISWHPDYDVETGEIARSDDG